MEVDMKPPPTSVVDNKAEVSRQFLDCPTQETTDQAEQSFSTANYGSEWGALETNRLNSSSGSETSSSQVRPGGKAQYDDTIDDEDNSTTGASKSSWVPKAESSIPRMKELPSWRDNHFSILPQPMHSPPMPPLTEARIMRMGSTEFKQKLTFSAIEVLLEEPIVTMRSRQKSRELTLQSAASYQIQPITKPNARKIRIRSPIILRLLVEIAKTKGHSFVTMGGQHPGSVVPVVRERHWFDAILI
jgi:hypothetical protein